MPVVFRIIVVFVAVAMAFAGIGNGHIGHAGHPIHTGHIGHLSLATNHIVIMSTALYKEL